MADRRQYIVKEDTHYNEKKVPKVILTLPTCPYLKINKTLSFPNIQIRYAFVLAALHSVPSLLNDSIKNGCFFLYRIIYIMQTHLLYGNNILRLICSLNILCCAEFTENDLKMIGLFIINKLFIINNIL